MESKTVKVAVFLTNGFEEIEAIAPVDLLQRAGIAVDTVSITEENLVESARKVKVVADKVIKDIDFAEYDMLVLPGGPGYVHYSSSKLLLENIVKFSEDGMKKVAAICAAPVVLSELGILKDRKAVCFPACEDDLSKGGAVLTRDEVVKDRNIITSRSAGTAIDFALKIIEELLGSEKAEKIAKEIFYK